MDSGLHFISGLPRAGSTLLAALLAQNPRFRAGMTGPVGDLVEANLKAMSMANDTAVFIDDTQREAVLRGLFEPFHGGLPSGCVAFDTHRLWCAKLPLIARLFPAARAIACVRDIGDIVSSIERLVQANPLQPSGLFGFDTAGTVHTRADAVGGGSGMVGWAYNALREAWFGPYADRLIVIDYATLVREPARALAALYAALGEPPFAHDVDNVRFAEATEFDRRLGTPGLHRVGSAVQAPPDRPAVLPPDLLHRYAADNFWRDPTANPNGVTVI